MHSSARRPQRVWKGLVTSHAPSGADQRKISLVRPVRVIPPPGYSVSDATLTLAIRSGLSTVVVPRCTTDFDGPVTVDTGQPRLTSSPDIIVSTGTRSWPALHVDMGNLHAVAFVGDLRHPGYLTSPPVVDPPDAYPHGVTVEFIVRRGPHDLALRVHERGVGETRACGTGARAADAATLQTGASPSTYTIGFGVFLGTHPGRLDITSGGHTHTAAVAVEVWDGPPPAPDPAGWDEQAEADFTSTGGEVAVWSMHTGRADDLNTLADAGGSWRARVSCAGRAAAAAPS